MTDLTNKRVLIVDDSALHRMHAESLLKKMGVTEILQAGNGIEALDVMNASPYLPDILLVDLEMPGMDGIELLQQVMQRNLRMEVVIVSSRENALLTTVEAMSQTLGIAILGALQKPLTLERLAGVLGQEKLVVGTAPKASAYSLDAITRAIDDHEFVCHYQPKVTLATGVIKGVEALARWQHPRDGIVYPDRFIDAIERHGAIMQRFTLALLDQVLAQLKYWHSGGLSLTVSLNISAQSFADARFVNQIIKKVEDSGVEPRHLILEVTETAIMTDIGASLGTLARLRLKGFGLSIDDYGTGFASMQQLSRIPATELKIDRIFVHGCHQRQHLIIMLESAIQMAEKLQLSVVAEGVELTEDWQKLKAMGCELAQGYLIAKAMPGDQLLPWIKTESKRLRAL
ncbi:EAL domain-containing response regulator [Permianibacter sp. IMCC34836]|uniref:EAL domain-containing response regulator n=1 Tax=Permianibacter fluminis TaxID=2738515 RepID=UPI0015577184|nr:EAL domain-containing response regulator [Permianibacter fluminis]NQD36153.1 EAL domain-containing response regulator [Permianibacter fluminis]